jgi:hypothetical protein
MGSRLANVRLDEARLRKARLLRERGIRLSDLVRDAIDERFEQQRRTRTRRDVGAILAAIFEEHPDPARLPPRGYDVHDRRQAQTAILSRLRRTRT